MIPSKTSILPKNPAFPTNPPIELPSQLPLANTRHSEEDLCCPEKSTQVDFFLWPPLSLLGATIT